MGGVGSCWQSDQLLNRECGKERGVWSTLVMEEGTFWYVGERLVVVREGGLKGLYRWLDH